MPGFPTFAGCAVLLAALPLLCSPSAVLADPDDLPGGGAEPLTPQGTAAGTLAPVSGQRVKFGVLGDFGVSGPGLAAVAAMIRSWQPDFIVSTGDNNYGNLNSQTDLEPDEPGVQCSWEYNVGRYFGEYILARDDGKYPFQKATVQRFYPCVGNHDSLLSNGYSDDEAMAAGPIGDYMEYFFRNPGGEPRLPEDRDATHTDALSFYAVRKGPVDFFFIDADAGYQFPPDLQALEDQKAWLSARLAESTARWKVAVFHQPPATSSFRASAEWMDWDELLGCDMVLCGHDHYYERLSFRAAVPLLISGAGGASIYGFKPQPHPASILRYNAKHSALHVTADQKMLRVECRAAPIGPADSEQTVEAYALGDPASAGDYEDDYSFFAEAGESITVSTATPGAQNLLDPALRLLRPDGQAALTKTGGMPDGKNVKLDYVIPVTGAWRVRVFPEIQRSGGYTLQLTSLPPGPDYSAWAAQLPPGARGMLDDPDGDGLPNLTEFATGGPPAEPAAGPGHGNPLCAAVDAAEVAVSFSLPSPPARGVTPVLEEAPGLVGPWEPSAWRTPLNDWTARTGARVLVRNSPAGGSRDIEVRFPLTDSPRRFYRLNFARID